MNGNKSIFQYGLMGKYFLPLGQCKILLHIKLRTGKVLLPTWKGLGVVDRTVGIGPKAFWECVGNHKVPQSDLTSRKFAEMWQWKMTSSDCIFQAHSEAVWIIEFVKVNKFLDKRRNEKKYINEKNDIK